ncbi:MAG: JAB domain-containing protein [Clostridia bacterium]
MENKDKKQIHSGHRERLYEVATKASIESLSEIQALELLLTLVIPRKDTNSLAHLLIDEFGSFSRVLEADSSDLIKINGVGERSAKLIKLFPELFQYYKANKVVEKKKLSSFSELEEYLVAFLDSKPNEELYAVALNSNFEIIITKKLSSGSQNKVELNNRTILDFVNKFNPDSIVIGHCHPDGESFPSVEDINSTRSIKKLLMLLDVKLLDHVIVGKDGAYSFFLKNVLGNL